MQLEQTLASQKLNQKSLDHLMQEVRKNLTEENQSLRANIRSMEEICQKGE